MHVSSSHSGNYVAQNWACYHLHQLTLYQALNSAYKFELTLNCVVDEWKIVTLTNGVYSVQSQSLTMAWYKTKGEYKFSYLKATRCFVGLLAAVHSIKYITV